MACILEEELKMKLTLLHLTIGAYVDKLTDECNPNEPDFVYPPGLPQYDLCADNYCKNNGTCSMDLTWLIAAVGPQIAEEYNKVCDCRKTSPKTYGQFCEFENKNDFRDMKSCKCEHGDFNWVLNPVTGCNCEDTGYHGWFCERPDQDLCLGNTIYAHSQNPGVPTCDCRKGFYGEPSEGCPHRCDISDESTCPDSTCRDWNGVNSCHCIDSNSCSGHGKCKPDGTCHCNADYYGWKCDQKLCFDDVCTTNPCVNGGKCAKDKSGLTYCQCPIGFSGITCANFDICASNPCVNGGVCVDDNSGVPRCECPIGYSGENCSNIDGCATQLCANGGHCVQEDSGSTHCECPIGFSGDECAVVDVCANNPCENGGECTKNDSGLVYCQCPIGFSGVTCSYINHCHPSYNACGADSICAIDDRGGHQCYSDNTGDNGHSRSTIMHINLPLLTLITFLQK